MIKKKCFFLDRDGVINKDTGYVHKISEFKLYNKVAEGIKYLNQKKYIIIIITNQSGIGRGYFTKLELKILHNYMKEKIKIKGGKIHDIFYCPYHPTKGIGIYKKKSSDRKPGNGMIEKAIKKWNISRSKSYMIGDKKTDLICAKKSKIKFFYKKKINFLDQVKKIID